MKKWAVLAGILLISSPSSAQSDAIAVLSIGADSCGQFVASDHQKRELYLAWTVGFISGANVGNLGGSRTAGDGWERDSTLLWLDNYCRSSPLDTFVTAVTKFRLELISRSK